MKIGIITFHWACNYGAVLQTYALQQVLASLGHDVQIVDYRPEWASDNRRKHFPRRFGEAINNVDFLFRSKRFAAFRKQFLNITDKQYAYGEDIEDFDVLITGSDQVFNPDIIAQCGEIDTTYLLKSASSNTICLSYAASFGNSKLAVEYRDVFSELLSRFDGISVREKSGCGIIESLGMKAISVPDPTILFGDFTALSESSGIQGKYLINFIFQQTPEVKMVQKIISDELQFPLASFVSLNDILHGKKGIYNPSPGKWIGAIGKAQFVLTDSFHSTVFCILQHRPFISLALNAWGEDWSERIKSLLEYLGLESRFIQNPTPDKVREIINQCIDWDDVDARLAYWREDGNMFIKSMLNLCK